MPKELSCQCLVYFGICILVDEVQPQKAWEGTWMLQFWGWTRMMPKELSCQCLVYFGIFILVDEVQPQKAREGAWMLQFWGWTFVMLKERPCQSQVAFQSFDLSAWLWNIIPVESISNRTESMQTETRTEPKQREPKPNRILIHWSSYDPNRT